MSYFFSAIGLQRLNAMADARMLYVFDFDGTLAPLVARPEDAELPRELGDQLCQLAEVATVAILSGRALRDLRPRLGFQPHYLMGNHGIEGVPGWEEQGRNYAGLCRYWAQELHGLLAGMPEADAGVQLENKQYSLSVHYRLAADPAQCAQHLQQVFARLQPAPRVMAGKCVFNLLPQGAADKGRALSQLMYMTQARGALYVGDDVTDEDVFRLHRRDILGVRTEYDAESAAEFFLTNQLEMPRLLDELTGRMGSLLATT
jgi:trehalose 6-phosphate phosphatase